MSRLGIVFPVPFKYFSGGNGVVLYCTRDQLIISERNSKASFEDLHFIFCLSGLTLKTRSGLQCGCAVGLQYRNVVSFELCSG